MSTPVLDYASRRTTPRSLYVVWYLQIFACFSVANMVIQPIIYRHFVLDVSPIFLLWAAFGLKRRSQTARRWVIGIGLVLILMCLGTLLYATLGGTQNFTMQLMSRAIKGPALWEVYLLVLPLAIIIALPVGLLLTPRVRAEFVSTEVQ